MNKQLFVMYRRNDLFDRRVPQIIDGLPVGGVFTIEVGTTIAENKSAYMDFLQKIPLGSAMLSDETCHPCVNQEIIGTESSNGAEGRCAGSSVSLDDLFFQEVQRWTKDQTQDENLVWFAKQVIGQRPIQGVLVVADCISDHAFAGNSGTMYQYNAEENWIATILGGALGVASTVTPTLEEAIQKCGDCPEILIVADRHCGLKNVMSRTGKWYRSLANWPHKSALFTLPFETCADQLIERADFTYDFDIANMRAKVLSETHISEMVRT
jgi:hypothetical protein